MFEFFRTLSATKTHLAISDISDRLATYNENANDVICLESDQITVRIKYFTQTYRFPVKQVLIYIYIGNNSFIISSPELKTFTREIVITVLPLWLSVCKLSILSPSPQKLCKANYVSIFHNCTNCWTTLGFNKVEFLFFKLQWLQLYQWD